MANARLVLRKAMRRRYAQRAGMPYGLRQIVASRRSELLKRPVRTPAWSKVKRRVYRRRAAKRGY